MSVDLFKPEVWHAELRLAYQKNLVYVPFCNRDYEGDIAQMGDTVHIDTIGSVTVADYVPGTTKVAAEPLDTTDQTLVIDQCKHFAFKVDDVDKRQVRGNMMTAGMEQAGYQLKDAADQFVAGLYTGVDAANTIPATYIDSGDTAFEYLINLGLLLDEANVAQEGRWCVAPPWFFGLLITSKYVVNVAFSQANAAIQSGQVGELAGFRLAKSNNVPIISGDDYAVLAGIQDATAFADQINEVEAQRLTDEFADQVRGLHLYGGKIIVPKGLALLTASKTATA